MPTNQQYMASIAGLSQAELEALKEIHTNRSKKLAIIAWIMIVIAFIVLFLSTLISPDDPSVIMNVALVIYLAAGVVATIGYRNANSAKLANRGRHTARSRIWYWVNFFAGLFLLITIMILAFAWGMIRASMSRN